MTRMPFYDFGARNGYRLGDRALVDGTVMMLTDPFHDIHMGVTAENVATTYGVSRQEQDEFAVESQRRAATAEAQAAFAEEIVPVEVGGRRPFTRRRRRAPQARHDAGGPGERCAPPSPRRARSPPATRRASTTAAAAVVLARESAAAERGLTPLVSLEAVATAAMEPELMGYAPVLALAGPVRAGPGRRPRDIDVDRAQRGLRLTGGRRHPGRQARPGQGQPVRRRHRPGSSGRRHGRHPVAARRQGPRPPRPRARHRHHVHRRRPGTGRALPEGLTWHSSRSR